MDYKSDESKLKAAMLLLSLCWVLRISNSTCFISPQGGSLVLTGFGPDSGDLDERIFDPGEDCCRLDTESTPFSVRDGLCSSLLRGICWNVVEQGEASSLDMHAFIHLQVYTTPIVPRMSSNCCVW